MGPQHEYRFWARIRIALSSVPLPVWLAVILFLTHLPLLATYFTNLWHDDHYQFFPFALSAFGFILWWRSDSHHFRWSRYCWVLLGLDVGLVVVATRIHSPWVGALGWFLGTLAICRAAWDHEGHRSLTYAALLPLLIIRLPMGLDVRLIQWLQSFTTYITSEVLHRLGIFHYRAGNVLEFPDKQFLVEEACSGVTSLYTVVFVAAFLIVWHRHRVLLGVALLIVALPSAALMNMARILATGWTWGEYGFDLSTGWQHEVLGISVLSLAVLLVLSSNTLLQFLFQPMTCAQGPGIFRKYHNPLVVFWNWLFAPYRSPVAAGESRTCPWLVRVPATGAIACGALLIWQIAALPGDEKVIADWKGSASSLELFSNADLPANLGSLTRLGFSKVHRDERAQGEAEFSANWLYGAFAKEYHIACDFPFSQWHGLELCYVNRGWTVLKIQNIENDQFREWPCVLVEFSKPAGERGYLVYSVFDEAGDPRAPPLNRVAEGSSLLNRLAGEILAGVVNRTRRASPSMSSRPLYQSQIFVEPGLEFTADEQHELMEYHRESRNRMQERLKTAAIVR